MAVPTRLLSTYINFTPPPPYQITEPEILKLCNRIKRRKHADEKDLTRLSNGFLWSSDNISSFLKNQGSLNVLVKELIGSSGQKQILTAEAVCNLSLGDPGACLKIAKQIATYLLPMLSSKNTQLAQTSLWILYNLIADDTDDAHRVHEVFFVQRIDLKLMTILEDNVDVELKQEATKCLSVVVDSSLFDCSRKEDLQAILTVAMKNWNEESPRLIYSLLKKTRYSLEDEKIVVELIHLLIYHLVRVEAPMPVAQQLYVIRVLGNLSTVTPNTSKLVVMSILKVPEMFLGAANALLQGQDLVRREVLWCLGNIMKAGGDSKEGEEYIETVVKRLVVPRTAGYQFRQYMKEKEMAEQEMEG